MNKRALMLTAATAALMSGPAFATCPSPAPTWTTITTSISVPVDTACADSGNPGSITIATNGTVAVTANPYTSAAATVDSGTIAMPNQITNSGLISYNGVSSATAVELLAITPTGGQPNGNVGGLDNIGTIQMTGTGTDKNGILIGLPSTITSGTFTGGVVPSVAIPSLPPTFASDPVAIYLQAASTVTVTGTDSFGIDDVAGATVVGDIDVGGALAVLPSTATSTALSGNDAIFIGSQLQGSIIILPGGSVEAVGAGGDGIVVEAPATGPNGITGSIVNYGALEAIGTTTPIGGTSTTDPEGGTALLVAGNVAGGIYNAGPSSVGDTVSSATIASEGTGPAVIITTAAQSGTAESVTIGTYPAADSSGDTPYSFINRGSISVSPIDPNPTGTITAVEIAGTSASAGVTLTGGIFDSGSITASATNDDTGSATSVTTLTISDFATVPSLMTNNTESGGGTISATVSGTFGGSATAVYIGPNGSLPTITNYGTIEAEAATSEPLTVTALSAEAIVDDSGPEPAPNSAIVGSITSITNYGSIIAEASILDNNAQIARAIDLNGSTQNVTVDNYGTIQGDIVFGTGKNTLLDEGNGTPAVIYGNIYFGGNASPDTLTIGNEGTLTGSIFEGQIGSLNVEVMAGGTLNLENSFIPLNGPGGKANYTGIASPLIANNFTIDNNGSWSITVSEPFNLYAVNPTTGLSNKGVGGIVQAVGEITLGTSTVKNFVVNFGSFVTSPAVGANPGPIEFVLLSSPNNINVSPSTLTQMASNITVPFLFDGVGPGGSAGLCTLNVAGSPIACSPSEVVASPNSQLDFLLLPKTAAELVLTGYAKELFPYVNAALANDAQLGAGVIAGVTSNISAQQVYSSFAPDVTGATRATAIALTDSATNVVAARQRELNMYANQEGDTTLWGQEFVQRLDQDNSASAIGYDDSGFGFALGVDTGDPSDGRYGLAFTFFSGSSSTKEQVVSKTASEFYMATFYTNWRGRGLFFDSQLTAAWATLASQRFIDVGGVSRDAQGNRPAAVLAGSVTTGGIFNLGSTVISPQLDIDGLTMREDGYSEGGGQDLTGGDGFDLRVAPNYANSARAFLGVDFRQDINLGDFYLQPEARAGYRYDFLDGAQKLDANFIGVTPVSQFTIEGPDPAKGNFVLGTGVAVTTGAWSVGLSYDFLRSNQGNSQQDGMLTLLGRI